MAIGFLLDDGLAFTTPSTTSSTKIVPDKSFKRNIRPRVRRVTFGDGYEQRLADGINTLSEVFQIKFDTRPKKEIDAVIKTLDNKKGVTAFDFTVPRTDAAGGEETVKVVCDDYSLDYSFGDFYSCSAVLRRVYEP